MINAEITSEPGTSNTTSLSILTSSDVNKKFTDDDLKAIKLTSETMKRNPKMDFSKQDLLRLTSYLEGELQAREVVIAVLKTEKVKNLINSGRYKPVPVNDPHAALYRDSLAYSGNIASRQSSAQAAVSEHEMRILADQRIGIKESMDSLASSVLQQRHMQSKMVEVLKDAEDRYHKVCQDLEVERKKYEKDTAQGDDITYGLEMERTKLKQDLEKEREDHEKLKEEMKKLQEQFDAEKNRQKEIVLLLLAERKKIIIKYTEERKRSEDLAQILSEEKLRVDSMAEGLEEESKKSLRMEAEMEKQTQQFDLEKKALLQTLGKEEKRNKEQELEITQLRHELELLKKQTRGHIVVAPQLPTKPGNLVATRAGIGATGIARSVSPGQSIRQGVVQTAPENLFATTNANKMTTVRKLSTTNATIASSNAQCTNNIAPGTVVKKTIISPGIRVPPPIPPNKPQIPPKLSGTIGVSSRIPFLNNNSSHITSNLCNNSSSSTSTSSNLSSVSQTNNILSSVISSTGIVSSASTITTSQTISATSSEILSDGGIV